MLSSLRLKHLQPPKQRPAAEINDSADYSLAQLQFRHNHLHPHTTSGKIWLHNQFIDRRLRYFKCAFDLR
ncbi:MAG: hypothetical protein KF688_10105 [Pirellulales bacterium]|nr:hypothetical protein [Pirellulales bacterium]